MPDLNADDRTIRLVRTVPRPKWCLLTLVLAVALAALGIPAFITWILLRPLISEGPAASPAIGMAGSASTKSKPFAMPARPGHDAPLADERMILATRASKLLVFRFRDAPSVLVLSFPSLLQQGDMLDRIAAFVEKAGLPHDRVLSDAELDTAIRRTGDTRETYYYGHDYSAADLARFYAAVDRGRVVLNAEETLLRTLLERAGMLTPNGVGALISIPPEVPTALIDATSRATILHHELSHGLFFTDAAYATYARHFWRVVLSEMQRYGFRRFLGFQGYDVVNEDLIANETQAFLIHTRDKRYFLPERAGLTEAEATLLRQTFVHGMPDSWLKTVAHAAEPRALNLNDHSE